MHRVVRMSRTSSHEAHGELAVDAPAHRAVEDIVRAASNSAAFSCRESDARSAVCSR